MDNKKTTWQNKASVFGRTLADLWDLLAGAKQRMSGGGLGSFLGLEPVWGTGSVDVDLGPLVVIVVCVVVHGFSPFVRPYQEFSVPKSYLASDASYAAFECSPLIGV